MLLEPMILQETPDSLISMWTLIVKTQCGPNQTHLGPRAVSLQSLDKNV